MLSEIEESDADVVCIQELNRYGEQPVPQSLARMPAFLVLGRQKLGHVVLQQATKLKRSLHCHCLCTHFGYYPPDLHNAAEYACR
jgi:hypothetical protein